ncbi:hypothetical protein BDQ17DRAFT_1424628 [Cyathus striatus]|nr:hypothetical protein BDQ17DRAFT_1424628 [Cyathus striatus]
MLSDTKPFINFKSIEKGVKKWVILSAVYSRKGGPWMGADIAQVTFDALIADDYNYAVSFIVGPEYDAGVMSLFDLAAT